MICGYCGAAGDMYAQARKPFGEDVGVETRRLLHEQMLRSVRYMHARCRGGTWCDCQHRVEDSLIGSSGAR